MTTEIIQGDRKELAMSVKFVPKGEIVEDVVVGCWIISDGKTLCLKAKIDGTEQTLLTLNKKGFYRDALSAYAAAALREAGVEIDENYRIADCTNDR